MNPDVSVRKAIVRQKLDEAQYTVEDIFTGEELLLLLSGKQRMNYWELTIGQEIHLLYSAVRQRGRMITGTDIKMDESQSLGTAIYKLDQRHAELKSKQEGDT